MIVLNANENIPINGSINRNNAAIIPATNMGIVAYLAAAPASAEQKMAVMDRFVMKLPRNTVITSAKGIASQNISLNAD